MKRSVLAALVLAAALVSPAWSVAAGSVGAVQPTELTVEGGEDHWHPREEFRVEWRPAPLFPGGPVPTAVEYRRRAPDGSQIGNSVLIPRRVDVLENVVVPSLPGRYTVEVRLFDGTAWGNWASASLRFDNARPGAAQPHAPDEWVAASAAATVRIDHPTDPTPAAGIAGYAVSVDDEPTASPCSRTDLCAEDEIDLPGGADDDTIVLRGMTEGTHFIHAVAVSGSGMRSAAIGTTTLRIDATVPDVELGGAPGGWFNRPVRVVATATDRLSGMTASGPGGPFTAIAVDSGPPTVAFGERVEATVAGEGVHRVAYYARDAAGNVADGRGGAPSPRHGSVRIDTTPPSVHFLTARDPADPDLIEAVVADSLSGPAAGRGWIGFRPAGSDGHFDPLPTTSIGGVLRARWDSDSVPVGNYEFRAVGFDIAGNAAIGERREDGARMVLAAPSRMPVTLRFGFGGRTMRWHRCDKKRRRCRDETIVAFDRRPAVRRVPHGRHVPVGGRLADAAGAPLAGLPIEIVEAFGAGARLAQRVTTAVTRTDGSFLFRLRPGPSRRIEVRFAGTHALRKAAGRGLALLVPAAVRFRASKAVATIGGAPVSFSGRVAGRGARIPASGLSVELQYRVGGGEWTGFRTVRTDHHGRFRYRYSFSDDDSRGVGFHFRAHVPDQENWPFALGNSRPVAVTGR